MGQTENASKKAIAMLWLTATIWGFAFVAQRAGMQYTGPFTFNGIRFALGSLSLLPFLAFGRRSAVPLPASRFTGFWKGGVLCGIVLFAAASLQQAGMVWTSAGKAGFITGLYVILVPLLGYFIGQSINRQTWWGALIAVAGLYLLTVGDRFSVNKGDLLVLMSAFCWAVHVQLINRLVKTSDPLALSILQFGICSLLSILVAIYKETINMDGILAAAIPLLYGGLMSVGVAYTLQVFAQRHVPPTLATMVLSFETVFAAIGGWLILNESMSPKGITGCLCMLAGTLLVQFRGTVRRD